MRAFRVPKVCDGAKLHDELAAAGVPVVTVRGEHHRITESAFAGVVVTEDSADPATVATVIAAHVSAKPAPSKPNPVGQAMADIWAHLEDGRDKRGGGTLEIL